MRIHRATIEHAFGLHVLAHNLSTSCFTLLTFISPLLAIAANTYGDWRVNGTIRRARW